MNQSPTSYAEYSELLTELQTASNRREILDLLYQGKLDWQAGVAERVTRLVIETANKLLDRMNKTLNQDIKSAAAGTATLETSLINARRWFCDILCLAGLPVLSEDASGKIKAVILETADGVQAQLEQVAQLNDRSGQLLHKVRQNPVNRINPSSSEDICGPAVDSSIISKRKIILP